MIVLYGKCRIEIAQGDVTQQSVDAVVNAANSQLAGGGGVDGAIHRAGGPSLMEQTSQQYPQGCPTGDAVVTDAGRLDAKHVFHAVGPIWRGGNQGEPELLASVYRRCLELAVEHECRSIAFPAISTGVYGYPIDLAAETSLATVRDFLVEQQQPELVRIVLFGPGAYGAFSRVLDSMTD
ncbi:MAG: O-acetyl-ADP-ribose deacetylase [Planctomycetes bacterium]|nr:O-acetyl-ADP-ribose deacetylase [Planctomycetota bacterium]